MLKSLDVKMDILKMDISKWISNWILQNKIQNGYSRIDFKTDISNLISKWILYAAIRKH